jgi:hypothetical protein
MAKPASTCPFYLGADTAAPTKTWRKCGGAAITTWTVAPETRWGRGRSDAAKHRGVLGRGGADTDR